MYHALRGLVFFLFVLNNALHAQVPDWADSIKSLKYQLDTISVIDTAPAETGVEAGLIEADVDTAEREYFLKKEFTDGLVDTLSLRQVPGHIIRKLKADKEFWYQNEKIKKAKETDSGDSYSGSPVLQALLWLVIIGGFLTFLIIYLSNSNTGLFRKSLDIANDEVNEENNDIFSINFETEIDKAAKAENFRLATRLMFLQLLRRMSDAGIIKYSHDGTNLDYMMQLHGTPHYEDFFRLARHYEFSWYGQFGVDRDKFNVIKKAFDNFQHRLQK